MDQFTQNDTSALGASIGVRPVAYGLLSIELLSFEGTAADAIGAQYSWPGMLRVELLPYEWGLGRDHQTF